MTGRVTRIKNLASLQTHLLADAVRDGVMEISDVQRLAQGLPPISAAPDVYVGRQRNCKADPKAVARAKEKARRKARAKQRK